LNNGSQRAVHGSGSVHCRPVAGRDRGIVLGPFGLGALAKDVSWLSAVSITDVGQIAPIAEFGVAFLLFMIALELSWNRLIELEFSCASGPLS